MILNNAFGGFVTKTQAFGALVVSAAISLFLFQNCSKVGATDIGGEASLSKAGASDSAALPSGPDDPSMVSANPPEITSTPVPAPAPAPTVRVTPGVDSAPVDKNPGLVVDGTCKGHDKEDDDLSDAPDKRDVAVVCLEASKHAVTLADGSDVIRNLDSKGAKMMVVQAHSLKTVAHNRGHLVIIGMGADAHIDRIEDGRGRTTVCNMKVDLISNLRGRLDLVDSEVTKIVNVHNIHQSANNKIDQTATMLKSDGDAKGVVHACALEEEEEEE